MSPRPLRAVRRPAACFLTSGLLVAGTPLLPALVAPVVVPPAAAQPAPGADPIGPDLPTEQRSECAVSHFSGADVTREAPSQFMLDLPRVHTLATGVGQKVAVIDTGVTPNPRLPRVVDGGDYVSDGDGLHDCDGHGTLVAGLIAAAPDEEDAFVGVAPAAEIISIRQASMAFGPEDRNARQTSPGVGHGYGNVSTLARAVVRAVDLGATVINISQVACGPSQDSLDDGGLEQAVRLAAERDIVVVVAAGNLQNEGPCNQQNPLGNPADPQAGTTDLVRTWVTPARFDDHTLAVAAVSPQGTPAPFSLAGPWVGVAAPGTDIVSLSTSSEEPLTDRLETQSGLSPHIGTSYSTAYVAGLAALLREQHPEWSAAQVIAQIKRTAHGPQSGPDPAIGAGVIDPYAALTEQTGPAVAVNNEAFVPPAPPPGPNPLPRQIAIVGGGILVAALLVGAAISAAVRREPKAVVTADGTDDSY